MCRFSCGTEAAERAAEKDHGPPELILVERLDVFGQLLPEGLPGQQRVVISFREPLEPAGPQVGGNAGREPPGDFASQRLVGDQAPFEQHGAGIAREQRIAVVGVGELLEPLDPHRLLDAIVIVQADLVQFARSPPVTAAAALLSQLAARVQSRVRPATNSSSISGNSGAGSNCRTSP